MLLAIDIGNSEITVGLFEREEPVGRWRLTTAPERTPDEWASVLGGFLTQAGHSPNEIRGVCLASVAPAVTSSLVDGARAATGAPTTVIDAMTPLPIVLDVDEPRSVGADRIVNTLAAVELYRTDTLVVDFGTATTFDCITSDARFIGGVIMPGLRTSADQLTRRAAKLPATELIAPRHVIGRRPGYSLRSGVLYGTADAVDGIVRRIRREWPEGRLPKVIGTGGLVAMVAPLCQTIEQVNPDLTLHGLRIAARHLKLQW